MTIDLRTQLKLARLEQKKSVPELAREIEANPQTLYNLESGRGTSDKGTLKILERLLNALGGELTFKK